MMMKQEIEPFPGLVGFKAWQVALVLAVFAMGLFFILPDFQAFFFGDEHFYTDSAIRMHQTGQILAPAYPDGSLRFNKPILSYWMILASFHAFGISVLSSRLPSLLAGLAILALTGLLTHRLSGSRRYSLLAMLVLASNIEFINASMRAMPDIYLCLATTASLFGFAGLLVSPRPTARDAWIAYLGAGVAIASKGLLGVVLLAFVFLFASGRRDRSVRLRALLQPLPMIVSLALALAWFVAVYVKYGDLFVQGFFTDQVGHRLSGSVAKTAGNVLHYSIGLALPFFPWSLLLAAGLFLHRSILKHKLAPYASALLFIAGWHACLMIVFSPANLTRTRYLLPGFPLLAAGAAILMGQTLSHPAMQRITRHLVRLLAVCLVPVALALGLTAAGLGKTPFALAGLGIGALAAALLAGLRFDGQRLPILLAAASFALVWSFYGLIRPVFPTTPAYDMVGVLRDAGARAIAFPQLTAGMSHDQLSRYKEKYASQIRLISGGTIRVDRLDVADYLSREPSGMPMICMGDDTRLFPSNRFTLVRSGSMINPDMEPSDLMRVLRARDRKAAFESLFKACYLAFPLPAEPRSVTSAARKRNSAAAPSVSDGPHDALYEKPDIGAAE